MERILVPVEDCPRLFKKTDNGDTPPQDLEGVGLGTVPKRVSGRASGTVLKGLFLAWAIDVMDIPGTVPKGGIHEKKLF